jgi:hypothetical protein
MYVCMYLFVYVFMHVCMHVRTYICMVDVRMHVCSIRIYEWMCVYECKDDMSCPLAACYVCMHATYRNCAGVLVCIPLRVTTTNRSRARHEHILASRDPSHFAVCGTYTHLLRIVRSNQVSDFRKPFELLRALASSRARLCCQLSQVLCIVCMYEYMYTP